MFADDSCIHVSDACYGNVLSRLQLSADEVFNWATYNFLTIHPQKTKYMIITTWQKHQRIPLYNVSITINKQPMERVSHIKFLLLGVIVDNNLSWAYHIKETTSKNGYWLNSINSNKINGSLCVYFKQAFYTISHTILVKKLSYHGLSDSCVQFLSSFLSARGQCVSFNKSISPLTNITRGVPQGSVLGSLLLSINTNDLPLSVLHETCDNMFADDTCIHVSDACYGNVLSTLQLSADEVFNWATYNFMTIHPQKTKYMIITTWQKHQRIPLSNVSITINKQPIEHVSHIKFLLLGVIVDINLSWAYHIKEITSKMAKSTYQLARIKNFIDKRCRKTFYHAYIHNKHEYGILLFFGVLLPIS